MVIEAVYIVVLGSDLVLYYISVSYSARAVFMKVVILTHP